MAFAETDFDLNKKLEDGCSKKDHLLSAWRQTNVMPEELAEAPPIPEMLQYLWGFFLDLSRQRASNGFGVLPLQYSDIMAWSFLNQVRLDPWELDAILRLDGAYLASANKPKKAEPSDD